MPSFDFDFGTDNNQFSNQFGSNLLYVKNSEDKAQEDTTNKENTDQEENKDTSQQDKKTVDWAGIISASALGLNSITNTISTFTGGENAQQTGTSTYQQREEEPQKKAPNPMLVIGIIVVVMVLIGLLAFARKAAKPPVTPNPQLS